MSGAHSRVYNFHRSSLAFDAIALPMKSNANIAPGISTSTDVDALMLTQLLAIAGGDRRAFEALYRQMYPALSRFLARHCAHRELIDEIINETFWVVWRKAANFRGDSKASTWVIGIAYRCMLKMLREHRTNAGHASADNESATSNGHDETDSEQRELREWLGRGMSLLPAEQRTTLELAYYLGQSCEEIAAVMGCAVGTVKARLFHARVRLRNSLPALAGVPLTSTLPPTTPS